MISINLVLTISINRVVLQYKRHCINKRRLKKHFIDANGKCFNQQRHHLQPKKRVKGSALILAVACCLCGWDAPTA
jgi:hypothetical protein